MVSIRFEVQALLSEFLLNVYRIKEFQILRKLHGEVQCPRGSSLSWFKDSSNEYSD